MYVIMPNFGFFFTFPVISKHLLYFTKTFNGTNSIENTKFKRILWSIIAGTRGGANRARILNLLKETPLNAYQMSSILNLDYKTMVHHITILRKNELIIKDPNESYGAIYMLTSIMHDNISTLEEIMAKIGTK